MARGAQTKPAREAPAKDAEERLLVEAAQKDPARFADLYDLHFDRVYAFIARRAGNRADAEDVTSEVFHRALANLPRFEWRGAPFAAWLMRIAANALADRWKRKARESANDLDEPVNLSEPDFVEADRRARVFRMLERLSADQRRVIQMRFAEEKSIREIAQALRRTEGAVKQLQFRGVQSLRELLGAKNG
jgi:RNA polymerase sigma-70 factor (ECF subfamily)